MRSRPNNGEGRWSRASGQACVWPLPSGMGQPGTCMCQIVQQMCRSRARTANKWEQELKQLTCHRDLLKVARCANCKLRSHLDLVSGVLEHAHNSWKCCVTCVVYLPHMQLMRLVFHWPHSACISVSKQANPFATSVAARAVMSRMSAALLHSCLCSTHSAIAFTGVTCQLCKMTQFSNMFPRYL